MTTSTEDLESKIREMQAEVDSRKATEANIAHFRSEDGKPITEPVELDDALLRAAGLAMQDRVKTLDWHSLKVDELVDALHKCLLVDDFTGVALYAAALNAQMALTA